MKQVGMLVVSLMGVNFGFWSVKGVPGSQHQYFKPPRNTELCEEKQKSHFLFNLFCFLICVFLCGLF